jgi:hypothetical protein
MNITTVSKLLALVALVFWAFYALRYVLGLPLFLTSEGEPGLLAQIGFIAYGYVTLLAGAFMGVMYNALREAKAEKKLIKIANVITGVFKARISGWLCLHLRLCISCSSKPSIWRKSLWRDLWGSR